MMAWKDHDFRRNLPDPRNLITPDNEWDVIDAPGKQSACGLRWIGLWPVYSVVKYDLKYRVIELVEGQEVVETYDLRGIDFFTLKQHMNWLDLLDAESAGEEDGTGALKFDLEFLLGLQIINPYKAHYGAPGDWNTNTVARLSSFLRNWVTSKSPKQLLTMSRLPKRARRAVGSVTPRVPTLYQELLKDPVVKDIERNWGIKVIENGIDVRDIGMTEELQKAFAAEQEQKLLAKGLAAQTADPVMQYLSAMTGKTVRDLQVEYNADPEVFNGRYARQISKAEEMAEQVLPLAQGRSQHMFPGADGIGKLLLGLVATARSGDQGGDNTPPPAPVTTPPVPQPTGGAGQPVVSPPAGVPMTTEEAEAFHAEMEELLARGGK